METLQGVLAALRDIVVFLGRIVEAISTEFSLGLDTTGSQLVGVLILGAFVVRNVFWNRANVASLKPQAFPLKTSQTPWEIVSKDVSGFLKGVFWVVVVFGVLFLLSRAGS